MRHRQEEQMAKEENPAAMVELSSAYMLGDLWVITGFRTISEEDTN